MVGLEIFRVGLRVLVSMLNSDKFVVGAIMTLGLGFETFIMYS